MLWAKPIVGGDVRIEYDYTHIDDASNPYVVILFIQAQGTGDRAADISTWQRPVASYPIYHGEMSNYSITYDNAANTVRARHNPGQAAAGEFTYEHMFERDETYHITIEKSGQNFSMTATNERTGASRTLRLHGQRVQRRDRGGAHRPAAHGRPQLAVRELQNLGERVCRRRWPCGRGSESGSGSG